MSKKHHSTLTELELIAVKKMGDQRKTYADKYPWLFALAGAFGIVSIFYGFEKLIDRVELFTDNPWILLATGVLVLAVSGTFYNKLK